MSRLVEITKEGNNYTVNPNASSGGGEPYNLYLDSSSWIANGDPVPSGEFICGVSPSYEAETGSMIKIEGNDTDTFETLFQSTSFAGSPQYVGSFGNYHFFYGYTG